MPNNNREQSFQQQFTPQQAQQLNLGQQQAAQQSIPQLSQLDAAQQQFVQPNLQNQGRESFVAVQKNGDGDITAFQTSGGRELDYAQALQEVQNGNIQGVNAFKGRDGETYIRGDADGDPSNNLDNLPTFS